MRTAMLAAWLTGGLIFGLALPAYADPPSDESLSELFALTKARQLVDGTIAQTERMVEDCTRQFLHGQALTPVQQEAIDRHRRRLAQVIAEEMGWEVVEPEYRRLYKNVFTQQEIDESIAFYRTPAGQAVILKLPAVMQQSLALVQTKIQRMAPKLKEIQQGLETELKRESVPPK